MQWLSLDHAHLPAGRCAGGLRPSRTHPLGEGSGLSAISIGGVLMLIRPGRLFDGRRGAYGVTVRVEGDCVLEMGDALSPRPGEEVLDAPGALLSPGFIDVHIHGIAGCDTMRGEADVRAMARSVAAHGVTGFLPTTMSASFKDIRAALEGVGAAMSGTDGARVLGCHLEGPYLNRARQGAQPPQFIVAPILDEYRRLTSGLEHAVKLLTLAPEVPGALELMDVLRDKVRLSAGHTDATCEQIGEAAAHGLTHITHMFNGMTALNHRAPGVPGAALIDDRLSVELIADLMHLHRTTLELCYRAKGRDRCILVTDAMEAADRPDGEYALGAHRVFVSLGAARLAEGNLAGSTLTMERAVRNMHRAAGVPLTHALQMATLNPARAIGVPGGEIVPGAPSDLVLLDDDLNVLWTMVGGKMVYQLR